MRHELTDRGEARPDRAEAASTARESMRPAADDVRLARPPVPPLRVCIVAPSLDILGGQAISAERLIEQLRDEPGIDVRFIPHNPRLPGPLRILQRIKYVRTLVTEIAYVRSLLAGLRDCDVVHVYSAAYWSYLLAPLPAILIGKWYGRRVILNYHSGEADDHLRNWPRSARSMRRADRIVVPSAYLVGVFASAGLAADAIPNFVDIARFPFRTRRPIRPHFLSNRNLEPLYDVGCVLRAFAIIQRARPDARLTVAGDGAERPALEALVRELGLRDVRFVGRVQPEAMVALYDEADVYLNSPNIDNMPNSVLEAQACGLPVVTTDAGGIPYFVTDGETGMLVTVGDHEAMAAAALRVLDEPALAERLAARARETCAERFSAASATPRWIASYEALLAARVVRTR